MEHIGEVMGLTEAQVRYRLEAATEMLGRIRPGDDDSDR